MMKSLLMTHMMVAVEVTMFELIKRLKEASIFQPPKSNDPRISNKKKEKEENIRKMLRTPASNDIKGIVDQYGEDDIGGAVGVTVTLPDGRKKDAIYFNFEGLDRVYWTMMVAFEDSGKFMYYLENPDVYGISSVLEEPYPGIVSGTNLVITEEELKEFKESTFEELLRVIAEEEYEVDATI